MLSVCVSLSLHIRDVFYRVKHDFVYLQSPTRARIIAFESCISSSNAPPHCPWFSHIASELRRLVRGARTAKFSYNHSADFIPRLLRRECCPLYLMKTARKNSTEIVPVANQHSIARNSSTGREPNFIPTQHAKPSVI